MDRETTKFVVRNVVSFCVGGTVVAVVKQNTYPSSKFKKVEYAVGGTAIAMMVTDDIGRFTDKWVDSIFDFVQEKHDPVVIAH